jgi:hypothetical protein
MVNFSTLPSLPLSYGSFYIGSASNRASEFATGSAGQVLTMVGGLPTWANPIASSSTGTGLVSSVFGRIGNVTAQNGDYNTIFVTESGSNLYFTQARAQNALSGTVAGINSNLINLQNQINTLSGIVASST